jgi:hypothetical protein
MHRTDAIAAAHVEASGALGRDHMDAPTLKAASLAASKEVARIDRKITRKLLHAADPLFRQAGIELDDET